MLTSYVVGVEACLCALCVTESADDGGCSFEGSVDDRDVHVCIRRQSWMCVRDSNNALSFFLQHPVLKRNTRMGQETVATVWEVGF